MNNISKIGIGVLVVGLVIFWSSRMREGDSVEHGKQGTQSPTAAVSAPVREFVMTSYYDPEAKKPLFSLPEMAVRKGDRVRIKVTNTFGTHNFKIDELNIFADTPLNQEVVAEFTADTVGEFVYYCGVPGHRQAGQFGTLRVTE